MSYAIGIDLGTTCSSVAVFRQDKVDIIANNSHCVTTPSCVGFTTTGLLIGDIAKNQLEINPTNTVINGKRLIGRKFSESSVKNIKEYLPYKVVCKKSRLAVEVEFKEESQTFYPEEITAMVLRKMKQTAEAFLDETVNDAVVTVPAYFNNFQRQATKDAGKIAGLKVLIINESTAAAITYGMKKKLNRNDKKNVMIVDLGGGALDVAIVNVTNRKYHVKSTTGDINLGGEDFVNKLFDYFAKKFENIFKKNLKADPRAVQRLKNASEEVKITLSSKMHANIQIDSLYDGHDFSSGISRAEFEKICDGLFIEILWKVESSLMFAKLEKSDIDDIVLMGGSTQMPKIKKLLQDFFFGKSLDTSICCNQAVAYGAAVKAAICKGDKSENLRKISICEVTSFSLGIEEINKKFFCVIQKNTPIPTSQKNVTTTYFDNQEQVMFEMFEGENVLAKDNNLLGMFVLSRIEKGRKCELIVEVTFDIDSNGILFVSASQKFYIVPASPFISVSADLLSKDQIQRMRTEAEKYKKGSEYRAN